MKQMNKLSDNISINILEKFARQDNYIVEKLSRHEDLQNEMFSYHELQTLSTFLNFEPSLKTMSDRVDAVTSLVEGLVSIPVLILTDLLNRVG